MYAFFLALMVGGLLQVEPVTMKPLDFQQGDKPYYLSNIFQLESNGDLLFLRGLADGDIVVLTPDGEVAYTLGGKGTAPWQFEGVSAMAVHGDHVFAVGTDGARLRHFQGEAFVKSVNINRHGAYFFGLTSHTFAVNDREMILPLDPYLNALGVVLDHEGKALGKLGEANGMADDKQVPALNAAYWLFDGAGNRWISVHQYLPLVTLYNRSFEMTNQFTLASTAINELSEKVYEFEPGPRIASPHPVFSDAKLFGGELFLMSNGDLHRVDLGSGKIRDQYRFRAQGVTIDGMENAFLHMYSFAFFADGTLVLAHPAMIKDHDLWSARLPQRIN